MSTTAFTFPLKQTVVRFCRHWSLLAFWWGFCLVNWGRFSVPGYVFHLLVCRYLEKYS